MKEKRLVAMFVTSAVTLVASLAITFGVFMTLADPVVATGVVRYEYAFNSVNNSLISADENTLQLSEDIVFAPSSSVTWSNEPETQPVWFNGTTYQDEIMYQDESISTKLKVVPFKVTNNYSTNIETKIEVTYDKSTLIGKYTKVVVYDYEHNTYTELSGALYADIAAGASLEYAFIVYVDTTNNHGRFNVNFGTDYEKLNIKITNTTTVL